MEGKFTKNTHSTVDASFLTKKIYVGERLIKLNIWDTAGQERYHALNRTYYQGASGILLVYDVTSPESFERVKNWVLELNKYIEPGTPIVVAGNKTDLIRIVPLETA